MTDPKLGRRGGCWFIILPIPVMIYATAAYAMGDNLVGQLMDQFQTWLSDKWAAIFDPIYFWYAAWIFALICAGIIATFVPFKIVRITLGLLLVGGALFIWGGKTMQDKNKAKIADLRRQLAEEKARRNQGGGNTSGGSGGGFFDFFK